MQAPTALRFKGSVWQRDFLNEKSSRKEEGEEVDSTSQSSRTMTAKIQEIEDEEIFLIPPSGGRLGDRGQEISILC